MTTESIESAPGSGGPQMAGVLVRPGARLAYEVTGQGPAVVLVHGFGLDLRMWDQQVAHLASSFQVVCYDCRGFGGSGPLDPAVAYSHADDLFALLDHLGIGSAVLVGLSFGGQVVMRAALTSPDRVRGLVLLDSLLDGVTWDADSIQGSKEVARQLGERGLVAARAAWLAHPLFTTARERPQVAGYPGQYWIGQDPHEPPPPTIDVLDQLATPTLVIAGELDVPCFREMSAVLARRIPGAEYRVIEGAGHMVNMEQPAAVNEVLASFLRQLPLAD